MIPNDIGKLLSQVINDAVKLLVILNNKLEFYFPGGQATDVI